MNNTRAGLKPQQDDLCNISQLITHYFLLTPDPDNTAHRVEFGTSGHRGCANYHTFNESHILAIAQSIADVRKEEGISGPLFIGKDTHALSEPAFCSVVEVLVANGVTVITQKENGYTPTPSISHAILGYNRNNIENADGIVITPSHNPPQDGGIKYNPPHGGPAESDITKRIENRANDLIRSGLVDVKRCGFKQATTSDYYKQTDLVSPYVEDIVNVINIDAIKKAGLKIGIDPLGGAGIDYWKAISARYDLDFEIINDQVDPTFRFMSLDKDGVIRMDCSSSAAMTGLLAYKDQFDLAFGNDPDFDRHGVVTPAGLMNPNHYLAVCIDYLFQHRPLWDANVAVGKTLVSSAIIDKVVANIGRDLVEVPVGFKWFVDGLYAGHIGFGGEESAGASFLRLDGSVWSTDKDGILLCLLAAEITAVTGKNPQQYYDELVEKLGASCYDRIQAPASTDEKNILTKMSPDMVSAKTLAGDPITAKLTKASGNEQSIGGLKVITEFGWFAARPSGTEDIYKIYCESFKGKDHLDLIKQEAQKIVNDVFSASLM